MGLFRPRKDIFNGYNHKESTEYSSFFEYYDSKIPCRLQASVAMVIGKLPTPLVRKVYLQI